jgi:phosphohistidine phosphatase SixA
MRTIILTLVMGLGLLSATGAWATAAGWALLRDGGYVVLLRHAYAPSSAEPAGFDIENCRTQRGLSERGRQQARRMGALFDTRAEPMTRVLASRFCRTLETAEIVFRNNEIEPMAALDPTTDDTVRDANRAEILEEIGNFSDRGNMVMVTHLEVIQALTGETPREGEAIIVRRDGENLRVLGRIVFN